MISEHPFQLYHDSGRDGAIRIHTGASQRKQHRLRPASCRSSVGDVCTDENPGYFTLKCPKGQEVGVKILNQSPPGPLKESVRCAEQNLYARSKELADDRASHSHEFTIQFRAFDACFSNCPTSWPPRSLSCITRMLKMPFLRRSVNKNEWLYVSYQPPSAIMHQVFPIETRTFSAICSANVRVFF